MKIKLTLLPALALAMSLAGCSSDEPGVNPNLTDNGTIHYQNGTSISLTAPGEWRGSRAYSRAYDEDNVNGACSFYMPGIPEVAADAVDVTNPPEGWQPWNMGFGGSDANGWQTQYTNCVVPEGKEFELTGGPIAKDIYVKGHLTIKAYQGLNGRVIVLPGGTVDFDINGNSAQEPDVETTTDLDHITVLDYGTLNFMSKNLNCNKTAQLLTDKDLNVPGTFNFGGKVFVKGALTCAKLDPNNGSVLHVLGPVTLTGDQNQFNNQSEVCMEDGLHAKHLEMNSNADFHIGCGLYVSEQLAMDNGMHLTTGYVQSPRTILHQCHVSMPDGGLADFGYTTFGSVDCHFEVVGGGYAMVNTTRCELHEQYSLSDVIPADYYFNYQDFYVHGSNSDADGWEKVDLPGWTADHQHEVTIGTTLINKLQPNAYVDGGCNPSFNSPDTPDTPDVPDTPDTPEDPTIIPGDPDADIILHVPSDYDRNLYLESDDFALRVDGQYVPALKFEGNQTTIDGVSVAEKGFDVKISGLKNLESGKEYTYELYLWVRDTTWESMTAEEKAEWVKGDGEGTDITNLCDMLEPKGFRVRKNVYRGVSGHNDTPYIKVSIHVNKL